MKCFSRISLSVAVLGLVAIAAPSRAAIWAPTISFDGVVDEYKDNSRANADDNNGNGLFDVGDVVYGLLRIGDKVSPISEGLSFPNNQQLIAIFSFQVTAKSGTGPFSYTFAPTPSTDAHSLYGLGTDADFRALQNGGASGGDWDKSVIAILEQTTASNPTLDPAGGLTVLNSIIGDDDAGATNGTINGWDVDMLLGFVSMTDFIEGSLTTDSIATILAATSPTPIGNEAGGLSVQFEDIGATGFLPIPITHLNLSTTTSHDLTFSSNITGYDGGNWLAQDNANFRINPTGVPEPASVAAWLGLGVCGTLGFLRRRKSC